MLTANPHVELDELPTSELIARFNKHVAAVQARTLSTKRMVYSIYCAKGYHKDIAQRALAGDDTAGNVALGAPHWVTYNDGTLASILNLI